MESAHMELKKAGLTGRIWTRSFDKRYCFDRNAIDNRITRINSRNKLIVCINDLVFHIFNT